MTIRNIHTCRICLGQVFFDGKLLYKSNKKAADVFLSDVYHWMAIDYKKFFKMDALSKAGFLAAELLLKDFDREQPKEEMGIVFFNRSSSLETDEAYQQTIRDKDNYYPSPAGFVYTLPNIVAGEIAIRNKIHGETAFFILREYNAKRIEETIKGVFSNSGLKYLLTGWVEVYNGAIDIQMMCCEANEQE